MDFKSIKIGVSPKQLSKLRNGRKVRIRPVMDGQGICVIVNPSNYRLVTRTFDKGKGTDLVLSPEELVANKEASTEMQGEGIFGKKFDKMLKKAGIKKSAYAVGDTLKPAAKAAILSALSAGGAALGASSLFASGGAAAPLAPLIPVGVAGAYGLASDYLDNPSKYQSNAGGPRSKSSKNLAQQVARDAAYKQLNQELGTNYGYQTSQGIDSYLSNDYNNQLANARLKRENIDYTQSLPTRYTGSGLYLGVGGRGMKKSKQGGAIGLNGSFVGYTGRRLPQALQSQPLSANFKFSSTLPTAYQQINKMVGMGLYV